MEDQSYNMNNNQTSNEGDISFGPRNLSFLQLVLKTFAGVGGGLAGAVIMVLIFIGASSILGPVLEPILQNGTEGEVDFIFVVVIMVMVLMTSIVSSMLSTLLLAFTERERYTRITTTMMQVFLINLVIFLFVLPIYLTVTSVGYDLMGYAAGLQIIMGALASALILELIHDYKYSLLAVYSTVLAILVGTGANYLIYYISGNATILLFTAIPIIWLLIGFFQAIVAMFYYWVWQTWGSDFLASEMSYGDDYGEIPEPEPEELLPPDEEGRDFLSNN